MKAFSGERAVELAKNVRAFFKLEAGLTRGATPDEKLREEVARKNGEISALRKELARARNATRRPETGKDTQVFFLVGHQKSGTTWLMKMLDAHPDVMCRGESRPFGRDWHQKRLKQLSASYPPASLYNAILNSERLRYWVERSVWTRGQDTEEHLNNLTRLAIEYFLTQELAGTGKRIVGDKTVLLSPQIVREISEVYPEAKVIHIIRDGRDVAVSTMHHLWNQSEDQGGHSKLTPPQREKREAYRKDPRKLIESGGGMFPGEWIPRTARRWTTNVEKTTEDGPTLLGGNYAEVRYEDLIERPQEEVGRLLAFLGASTDTEVVEQCVGSASFERLSEGRSRGEEGTSFYRKGVAGDWKNVFTEENQREFEAVAGELLERLGYATERSNSSRK